ncbi:hypothetical protein O181_125493, partial [Austropuccinia psidii MF-1]|nr:hypothetical protein [Austropuccinia psidii MF-1]
MTPTRSGSNYSIQSNGSGPGHSSQKSKRQECKPRGEAQMEDSGTSTSSQRLASAFDTLIESPEADITAIPVVRPESFPKDRNRDIPVSVHELVYGSKAAGVGTYTKSLDKNNEILSLSEEFHGPRKDKTTSEGLDTHVLQGTSPTDKTLVKNPKHVVRGPEEKLAKGKDNSPVEAPQASTSKRLPQQVPSKDKQLSQGLLDRKQEWPGTQKSGNSLGRLQKNKEDRNKRINSSKKYAGTKMRCNERKEKPNGQRANQ